MKLFSKAFARYAAERAIKTVGQSALALLIAGQTSIVSVDWAHVGAVSALAGVVSLLTSVTAATGAVPAAPADPTSVATVAPVPAPVELPAPALDDTQVIPVVKA